MGATAALAVVACAAGCGSSSGTTIPKAKMSSVVLQQSDVPKVFSIFYFGHELMADQSGPRRDITRFDRIGGWVGRYHRAGSSKTKGPLVISSKVDLFKNEDGAKKDFELYQRQLFQAGGAKEIDPGTLGDQAAAVTTLQQGAVKVRNYAIAWREANATAELELNGFEGRLTLDDALELARKQERRLRNAAR